MFKIVIAEDDRFTRNGIASLIVQNENLNFEIAGEAQDGEAALQLVRTRNPDVILTDINMPKLNGLELIQRVKKEAPEILIIIISGYNDFQYMKSAIQLGVKDYLLKPVLPDQIREILVSAKEVLNRRRKFLHNIQELKQQVQKSMPILRERFYNELVSGKLTETEIWEKARYLKIDLTGNYYAAAILEMKDYLQLDDSNIRKEDLMQCFLFDVINKIYASPIRALAFAQTDHQVVILFCIKELKQNMAFMQITHSTTKLVNSLKDYFNLTSFAAISRMHQNVTDFNASFAEAKEALIYSFSMQDSAVINFDDICFAHRLSQKRPAELDEKIIRHVKLGERAECETEIKKLFRFYHANRIEDPRLIKMDVFEIIMLVFCNTGYIFQNSMETISSGYKCSTYQEILQCETLNDLEAWTLSFFNQYLCKIEKERVSRGETIVEKVKEIVELSYGENEFSLDDVASTLFISPNYLRQIFKSKTGESFVEYLTKVRMKKAADLLADDTLKVQQISEKVGYDNQQYFAMCFRKHFGCTPSDYRRLKAM